MTYHRLQIFHDLVNHRISQRLVCKILVSEESTAQGGKGKEMM